MIHRLVVIDSPISWCRECYVNKSLVWHLHFNLFLHKDYIHNLHIINKPIIPWRIDGDLKALPDKLLRQYMEA